MKKRPPFNENAAVRSAIRRVFSRSPIVREVMFKVRREVPKFNKDGGRAKKDAVQYQCGVCSTWTKSTAISVDHIEPVISVDIGFQDWNEFVRRLFCKAENLQVICDGCHQKKTNKERFDRQLKKDQELVWSLENEFDCWELNEARKSLAKFTTKKLLIYPQDMQQRIVKLKNEFGRKTKNPPKHPKGKL